MRANGGLVTVVPVQHNTNANEMKSKENVLGNQFHKHVTHVECTANVASKA